MLLQNKRFTGILLSVAFLLLLPLIAMQFTNEVKWTLSDFVAAGILLFGTGIMVELVLRNVHKTGLRIALCVTLLTALALVWIELAVGIFGTPFAGN